MKPKALVALDILMQGGCIKFDNIEYYLDRDGDLIRKMSVYCTQDKDFGGEHWVKTQSANLSWFIKSCEKLSREELMTSSVISYSNPTKTKYRWKDEERMIDNEWMSYGETT